MILFRGDNVITLDGAALYPFPAALYASLNWPSIALGLFSQYTSKNIEG